MNMEHLTDEQIQAYTFDRDSCLTSQIEAVTTSKKGRAASQAYSDLAQVVQEIPEPHLHFDIAERVLQKISEPPKRWALDASTLGTGLVLGIGIMVLALSLAMDVDFNIQRPNDFTMYFIVLVGILISGLWSLYLLKTYHKKMTILKYL